MGKILVIAEKPSVAADLAKVLKAKKDQNIYEGDEYVISSAIGHLVTLEMPEDINSKKYSFWRLEELPIIPEIFGLKIGEKTKSQFTLLKSLIARKDIDSIINACDAGREGELIFAYIYDLAKGKKPVKRLWMQSMTKDSIVAAFKNLRDNSELKTLCDAAKCRSEADWLIGLNGTRGVTKRTCGKGQVATVGRVQTPTLAIIYQREQEIKNFVPRDYWKIESEFGIKNGNYFGTLQQQKFIKNDDKENRLDRFFNKKEADKVFAELQNLQGEMCDVKDEAKRTKKNAPPLFDLTSLQREANNRFGYSATRTLQIAQSLYETHKMLTYPRTDSRALPEDYIETCKETMKKLEDYRKFTEKVLKNKWIYPNKKIFDNKKISDHFAIIPTGEKKELKREEQNIYDLVTKRFIAIFYPAAEYDETERTTSIKNHTFKTSGKVLVTSGWLEIYGKNPESNDQDQQLVALCADDKSLSKLLEAKSEKLTTKPPPRYTEATLLSAMENAGKMVEDEELADAMKEKGLGTPATRASIIEKLFDLEYLQREEKSLIPTSKVDNLMTFLTNAQIEFLTQAELTGEWEFKLNLIEKGKLTREKFMEEIANLTREMVSKIKGWEDKKEISADLVSPSDNLPMIESSKCFASQDKKITIYKNIAGRAISIDEIKELLKNGQIGPFDNFVSKARKNFSATLLLGEEGKVAFKFAERESSDANNPDQKPSEFDQKVLAAMKNIKWNPAERKAKRVYDDSAFHKSLEKWAQSRPLSPAQKSALKKLCDKYAEQIPNYADLMKDWQ